MEKVCKPLDVPYFSCKGYPSVTELWEGAQRMIRYAEEGSQPVILYFGDHDPTGVLIPEKIQSPLSRCPKAS